MPWDGKIRDIIANKRASPRYTVKGPAKFAPSRRGSPARKAMLFSILAILIIFGIAFGAKLADLKTKTVSSGREIITNARQGASDLENFNTAGAKNSFASANGAIQALKNELDNLGFSKILSWSEWLTPLAKTVPLAINDFVNFSGRVLALSQKTDELIAEGYRAATLKIPEIKKEEAIN